jgi:hypothetical protein
MAAEADVEDVLVVCDTDRKCSFHVAVRHADEGWDHYADEWRILDGDGGELGKRVLHHPHVDEQPFTRSLSGIAILAGVSEVTVEAHCNVDGYGGKQFRVFVPE